jgi:hypothetical protein
VTSLPRNYYLLPALKQNLGGRIFKDICEMETVVTRWLIIKDMDRYQEGIEKVVP